MDNNLPELVALAEEQMILHPEPVPNPEQVPLNPKPVPNFEVEQVPLNPKSPEPTPDAVECLLCGKLV